MPIHGFPGGVISSTAVTPSPTSASGVWTLDEQFQNAGNWPAPPPLLTNSLRFRSSASAYLNRTPASNGNRQRFTFSYWVKRGTLSVAQEMYFVNAGGGNFAQFSFTAGNAITFASVTSSVADIDVTTTAVFRDPSSWYHIVLSIDTTQATSSNRVLLYVNGVLQTITGTLPAQNTNCQLNTTTSQNIGRPSTGTLDGYLAEYNFIDGQALTPSSFGATSPTTGVWQPKKYAGTYGTNGFYLPFTNNASTSTLGNDFSGNGNNWTTNNISLTAGATYDSMTDVPTLTSATASNYCVMNPLAKDPDVTMSNGNLQFDCTSGGLGGAIGTFAVSSGKWYWEVVSTAGAGSSVGIAKLPLSAYDANQTGTYLYLQGGDKRLSPSTDSAYGASWTTNDVIGIALDMDAGTVVFYKNNASQGTAFSSLSGDFTAWVQDGSGGSASTIQANFGQRPFAYTPPTGFVALNTFNLPTPTIGATASTQANKYFDATTYTGNGTSSITVVNSGGMQPDLVWGKSRSNAFRHGLVDSVRGVSKALFSELTDAEDNLAGYYVTSFNSNGFSAGNGTGFNSNGSTYVAWQWKANGTGVTNTAGSITSTVSANTSAGFSVVTYTGNGANATVGHGLGVAPKMVIVKRRNSSGTDWSVWHTGIGTTQYLILNGTIAAATDSSVFNGTFNSTVFSVGGWAGINGNTNTYVAYCFSEIAGYSRFGSYTGNGSADGPFIFTGFRPRFVMIKQTSSTNDWGIFDTARNTFNSANNVLYPNLSNAEGAFSAGQGIDILSNGFKARLATPSLINTIGASYIYYAVAESPFKYANAR